MRRQSATEEPPHLVVVAVAAAGRRGPAPLLPPLLLLRAPTACRPLREPRQGAGWGRGRVRQGRAAQTKSSARQRQLNQVDL
jgi:hypothetical protein